MALHTIEELKLKQRLPLEIKIRMSKDRIRSWIDEYGEEGVYVSFSGGKDSTVLLDLVRQDYPNVKAVFVDTGLEYPEIKDFVKTFDNVDIVKPKLSFRQVIDKYGYPFISKEVSQTVYEAKTALSNGKTNAYKVRCLNGQLTDKHGNISRYNVSKYKFFLDAPFKVSHYCCNVMKKRPAKDYEKLTGKKPILATMTEESQLRVSTWLRQGCNAFDVKRPNSKPLSFWTEQDILRYIKTRGLKIASVYGDIVVDYEDDEQSNGQLDFSDLGLIEDTRKYKTTGCRRTGCMFCGFGCQVEKPGEGRFERMKVTHPKIYDYIMRPKEQGGLNYKEVIDWINDHSNLDIKY